MNHDDNVRPRGQREAITSFLVCAITAIFRMNFYLDSLERTRDRDGIVVACVIHDDHKINNPLCHHLIVGALQSAGGIIGGHYYHNFLAVQHRRTSRLINVSLSKAKNLGLLLSTFLAADRDVSPRST